MLLNRNVTANAETYCIGVKNIPADFDHVMQNNVYPRKTLLYSPLNSGSDRVIMAINEQ